jgi:putative DNA primase/helicase
MRPTDRVLERLDGVERRNGYHVALCPAHGDRKASLSITEGNDGRALLHCHAGCAPQNIVSRLGLEMRDLALKPERNGKDRCKVVESYDYQDAEGRMLFQTLRMEPKDFRQRRPDGRGGWEWNLKGVEPVLYRLPDVVRAVESGDTVFVFEGEKDVERVRSIGLVATTNPMGAGKWRGSYSESLRGANVDIVPDNDQPGREHAKQVAQTLQDKAASVKIVEVPGLSGSEDVSDWLDAGGTAKELKRMAREAHEVSLLPSLNSEGHWGHPDGGSKRELKAVRFRKWASG